MLILASNSPRRKEILSRAGYEFLVIPSSYDENICNLKYSDDLVINCAYQKALDVSKREKSANIAAVIGADTVVVLDGVILGKPKDEDEAFSMLRALSDKTHFVATSVCLIFGDSVVQGIEKTSVTFRTLSDSEILTYIKYSKPLDKAGSYGIQDEGFDFAIKIEGELDNVTGFPIKLFNRLLADIPYSPK